jgi:anhydro-N-acetylmuramic acid kinase
MSGTSLDGIDAAIIKTDGEKIIDHGPALSIPYDQEFREQLRSVLGLENAPGNIIAKLTENHAKLVNEILKKNNLTHLNIDIIGFHGQTILHDPENQITVQIGDGQQLADLTGIDVVCDFRSADIACGGEGAPLAPLYHQALAQDIEKPLAVVNIGGVGNITYLEDKDILAFDTGPGNALIDDWMVHHSDQQYDEQGRVARHGKVDKQRLAELLAQPYFDKPAPKSLDRDQDWKLNLKGLSLEDGAALLTEFTAASIAGARQHLPDDPKKWLITGGGRHNKTLMEILRRYITACVQPVEIVGWHGDDLEAEAFAFLAVRSLKGLPLSVPGTTGVKIPMVGGKLFKAKR